MNGKAQQGGSAGGGDGHGDPGGGGEGLEARLKRLEAKLAERKPKPGPADDEQRAASTGYAQAVKLSSEFIAAVAVGFAIGFGIDRFLGTKPWGMIVFLLLGFGAGVLNVMRSAGVVAEPSYPTRGGGAGGDNNGRGPRG